MSAEPMRLRPITMDDLGLYRGMLLHPAMMAELGGPLPEEGIEEKLRTIVADVETDTIWFFVVESQDEAAGTICIWDHDGDDPVTEIGWMIDTPHQGRGLGSEAVREILDRARADGRWREIHAYPAVTNGASNAICRKAGFELLGSSDFVYQDRPLRCNDWRIIL